MRINNGFFRQKGLTLLEMLISVAIMAVVFVAILPQFKNVQNNWDSRRANAEMLQNGRVLTDHLKRTLADAYMVTAVSLPTETNGYLEFEDVDGNLFRYQINVDGYVEYGPVGNLAELAGPVNELRFTCYAVDDLDTVTLDTDYVRFVMIDTTVTSDLGRDMSFSTRGFIEINAENLPRIIEESDFEFDIVEGQMPVLCQISDVRYLCAYSGADNDGYAVVLNLEKTDWTLSKGPLFEFDTDDCVNPALYRIDSDHYLCVYTGTDDHGIAAVLEVDISDDSISKLTTYEFDNQMCLNPDVIDIGSGMTDPDDNHFLCVYSGTDNDGWAVVLTVDTDDWSLNKNQPFEFDSSNCQSPCLSTISNGDNRRFLCVYNGVWDQGIASVLIVNSGNLHVSESSEVVFDNVSGKTPSLVNVKNGQCLCVYEGTDSDGYAVVLDVDLGTWSVSAEEPFIFDDSQGKSPTIVQRSESHYVCIYSGDSSDGYAVILGVDTGNGVINKGRATKFDDTDVQNPDIVKIDSDHYLSVYDGGNMDGWASVFSVDDVVRP